MKKIFTLAVLILISNLSFSQTKSPSEFLGYELGEQFTYHYKVVDYFYHLQNENPTRIKLIEYGRTNEDRPLLYAILTSADNLSQIESIRANNKERFSTGSTNNNTEDPAIVWLSYNVHGNEANSTEASMKTAYDLLTKSNNNDLLEKTIVIIDPCLNPDGRDRYVHWFRQQSNIIPDIDPIGREHHEPWPGGRQNHYLFDLNRDWAWLTQVESKARVKVYNEWMPHIHVDFHEQGYTSPYYFAPAAEPYHDLISDWQREFQVTIGKNNAAAFDANGWQYFTKEVFDLLYPSYGDTYPMFNGSIGMTYEQGGHSFAGLGIKLPTEDTLTLKDRLDHHYTSGMATIKTASENRKALLDNFSDYFSAPNRNMEKYKSFVISSQNNQAKIDDLLKLLNAHNIKFGKVGKSFSAKGFNYETLQESSFSISSDDILIPGDQPKSTLVNVLLAPNTNLSDSITYDITSWSLFHSYGLKGYALTTSISIKQEYKAPEYSNQVIKKSYAYLVPFQGINSHKFLAAALSNNFKVSLATEELTVEGKVFEKGTLIIMDRVNRNTVERFDDKLNKLLNDHKIVIESVSTGFVTAGPDLGSSAYKLIEKPKIALMSGEETSPLSFGENWYYFEQLVNYPIHIIRPDYFNKELLSQINTLILPNGRYQMLSKEKVSFIEEWVKNGNKLILIENAINSLDTSNSSISLKKISPSKSPGENEYNYKSRTKSYGNAERESTKNFTPGAIINYSLDNSHPISFGLGRSYRGLKTNSSTFELLKSGWNIGYIEDNAIIDGFVGTNLSEKMTGTLGFGSREFGGGEIIYFIDNPLLRCFWYEGLIIYGNAIFY
ncbi:M14 metallopeptidase family protein [Marinigracilibium pacificum]|uniref:Zinc carboxypeptidase n=1 Tax=Marinigracilibium pacificum TaxID=2729599 RepID=A0A848IXH1_9BACT|nr:M14 metallopeptidase family protein [Marinigracilibium pacificum]NMM46944.1 zinc carboxypeptidase [Marinigracilibium pacificum]